MWGGGGGEEEVMGCMHVCVVEWMYIFLCVCVGGGVMDLCMCVFTAEIKSCYHDVR